MIYVGVRRVLVHYASFNCKSSIWKIPDRGGKEESVSLGFPFSFKLSILRSSFFHQFCGSSSGKGDWCFFSLSQLTFCVCHPLMATDGSASKHERLDGINRSRLIDRRKEMDS